MSALDEVPRRAVLRLLAAAGAVTVVGACSDDDDAAAPLTPTTVGRATVAQDDLPVNDTDTLRRLFDPLFEPLGQRVTRIGLYDLSEGFVRADDGDHLAIYVEPTDPAGTGWDDARYIERAVPGMAAATTFAFERWRGLRSVDVCQEPPQQANAAAEPPIETQLLVHREASADIDWETAGLADLIAASLRTPDLVEVRARKGLEVHPLWRAAVEHAGRA